MKGEFNPDEVSISLFGCCSYEETWHPGVEGWGDTDEQSRASGYVDVADWDKLLALYRELQAAYELEVGSSRIARPEQGP